MKALVEVMMLQRSTFPTALRLLLASALLSGVALSAQAEGIQLDLADWRAGEILTEQDRTWVRNHPDVYDVIVAVEGSGAPVLRIHGQRGVIRTARDVEVVGPEVSLLVDFCLNEGGLQLTARGSNEAEADRAGAAGFQTRGNQEVYLSSYDGVNWENLPAGFQRGQWYRLLVDYILPEDQQQPPQAKVWLWAISPAGMEELTGGLSLENGWQEGAYPVEFKGLAVGLPPSDQPGDLLVARAYLVSTAQLPSEFRNGGKNPLAPAE